MGSLLAVSLPDGRRVEYATDGANRRIGKMVNGVLVRQWLYRDDLRPVAELDGSGNLLSEFIYGTKANVPDLVIRSGNTYRVLSDQVGSPVMAINVVDSDDVPFQATYSAFGARTLLAGTDEWMPLGFAGGVFDPDTKLTRFGARDYDARFGRWVSKDPILFVGHQSNLYVYVMNDPVNWLDPDGHDPSYASVAGLGVGAAGLAILALGPPGWAAAGIGLLVVGGGLTVWDNLSDATSGSDTFDRAKQDLGPYYDYGNRQEDQLKQFDQCQ